MSQKEIVQNLVSYFRSDHWQELMRLLTQTEEEIYHVHLFVENKVEAESLSKLVERYFERRGLRLDRKIDIISPGPDQAGLHSVHPHDPERAMYTPAIDMFWRYNPEVLLEPAPPSRGEGGKNIIGWGKNYMDDFLKRFDFKTVGPEEERKIYEYFQSSHWKKCLRWVEDDRYTHIHANVEINFHPWILKMFAMEALKGIGWNVDHVIPCVYHISTGYQGKIVFLTAYPEKVWDIAWGYNPDVVIKPAKNNFAGFPPGDGDPAFDVWTKSHLDKLLARDAYESITGEQIEEIVDQVH